MQLSDRFDLTRLLSEQGFTFKKSLGQNFLIDSSVCPRMAEAAATEECGVLEIGPGAGVLTRELAKRAKKVVAIELDERLRPLLSKTLAGFENAKVIFGDAMKLDLPAIINEEFLGCEKVTVCANLPYYITSPMIMTLLEQRLPIESITVMVQKEAAERICAEVGSRESGAVTVAVSYYSEPQILFEVNRECFLPAPKVDSAVISLKVRTNPPIELISEQQFFKFVKACFGERRKTLANSVSSRLNIKKEIINEALQKLGLDPAVRAEKLKLEELAALSNLLFE